MKIPHGKCNCDQCSPEPTAPTWRVGDRAVFCDEAVVIEALPTGRGTLLCVRFDDGSLDCVDPSELTRPALKPRTLDGLLAEDKATYTWDELYEAKRARDEEDE